MFDTPRPRWILPAIVMGQVLVTSTWFAANAIINELQSLWGANESVGHVTVAVQFGFIAGTLFYATLGLADRFSPGRVFLASSLLVAACNGAVYLTPDRFVAVLAWRFLTGFWLAGVYPVGMKIAAAWYREGLARALGYLVGALVLGTALPHLLRGLSLSGDWRIVILGTSLAAIFGGLLVWSVPEGPNLRRGGKIHFGHVLRGFDDASFRSAVLAYFGHMWELYAFWAFVPLWLMARGMDDRSASLATFAVIAAGAAGCILGGLAARRWGSDRVAWCNLVVSAICCLASPAIFSLPSWAMAPFVLVWGFAVVGDSPQLSTLNALYAPREVVGSALTLATCLGFAITIASIWLLDALVRYISPAYWFLPLAIGPALGAWRLWTLVVRPRRNDPRSSTR